MAESTIGVRDGRLTRDANEIAVLAISLDPFGDQFLVGQLAVPRVDRLVYPALLFAAEADAEEFAGAPARVSPSEIERLHIHLLLTDFQMPEMDGIQLATAMSIDRPQLKVLMMSGFTGGMLVLNEGWHFLPKPFVSSQLLALVVGLVSPDQKSRFSK